jgi:hypothetical protein
LRHEFIHRQVALVSYGTKFLRGELALEDWHRHGIFRDARLQFRRLADNVLLADDFTLWLGILKQSGATRLSLHLAAGLGVAEPRVEHGGDYVVVAHSAEHYQLWAVGKERSAWAEHPLMPNDEHQMTPVFPDAAYYGGELDSYWCVAEQPGVLEVPKTHWDELVAAVRKDLDINLASNHVPAGLFFGYVSEQPAWAKLPLFPSSKIAYQAHRLLATLDRERSIFDNDMNPKNDGGDYYQLDQKGLEEKYSWGQRLDSWIIEVQLRCANEYR